MEIITFSDCSMSYNSMTYNPGFALTCYNGHQICVPQGKRESKTKVRRVRRLCTGSS